MRKKISRREFIESHGATCANWAWCWSFINEKEKLIIFSVWDIHEKKDRALILSEDWEISTKGRKQSGYGKSREHIRLIEEEGYNLKIFPIIYSDANKDKDGIGPAKIEGYIPEISEKKLLREGNSWYATNDYSGAYIPEEVDNPGKYAEGALKTISVNIYERNPVARRKCLEYYGYDCAVCLFNFEIVYGPIGKEYIHVHHIVPLHEVGGEYKLDPIKDLIPVCPNCHAMIHSGHKVLSIDKLKRYISRK